LIGRQDSFALGSAYRLTAMARPQSGPAGQNFGKGTGSSLEFQEFRDYQAGDDLRHVDWRAYARTETLTTRLYRQEVAATVELIVDGSRSMEITPAKAELTRQLTCFVAGAASPDFSLRGLLASDPPQPLHFDQLRAGSDHDLAFSSATALADLPLGGFLRAGGIRIVISDFLFSHDARQLVQSLGAQASSLILLQVLEADEWDPPQRGSLRLHEIESGSTRELTVDERTVQRYRQRIRHLHQALQTETRRRGGLALRLMADQTLPEIIQGPLLASQLFEVR
jgi:uncharacterized protein (DUF58 family)